MQGHRPVVAGIIKGQHNLIIVHEYGIEEGFYQPPLTVDVGVIHVGELMEEEEDVLFLESQILFQLGSGQRRLKVAFLLLQFVHPVLGAFIENTGFDSTCLLYTSPSPRD